MKNNPELLAYALRLYDAGMIALPLKTDGSKAPDLSWKAMKQKRPSRANVESWFVNFDTDGMGVLCGEISGELEMLEFEGRAITEGLLPKFIALLKEHGLGELWSRISVGWMEETPGGGYHWYYRVSDGPAKHNIKLAVRPATAAELLENPKDTLKVLIETRGDGGFSVVCPSCGRSHPTGRPWLCLFGGPESIPLITSEERDLLHMAAAMLNTSTTAPPADHGDHKVADRPDGELLPGDDYAAKTTWAQILEPRGWRSVNRNGFQGWIRPGKTTPGISATTGRNEADNLWVFSSSTEFETEVYYSKFAAYAFLEHGNDYGAAAGALRRAGFGGARPDDGITFTGGPPPPPDDGEPPPFDPVPFGATEDGVARALALSAGDKIRFCAERNYWLAWDGQVWNKDVGAAAQEVLKLARQMPGGLPPWTMFRKRALSAAGVAGILKLASLMPALVVHTWELDAHPFELNTPGGTVDLRTGKLMEANPASLHTRMTSCTPNFEADSSAWARFLNETFGDDKDLIAYLARMMGCTAIGEVGPHVLPFCQGGGGNGKGVFLETFSKILGGYAIGAPAGFLVAQTYAKHETEIARLSGARMVLCSEVNDGDRFDEAKVKQLTGGDTLTGRFMRGDHFSFLPTHQLWLMGNSQPAVEHGGRAFWRRMHLIRFERDVVNEIENLQGILALEFGPAILAWIINGAVEYLTIGLKPPASVLIATEHYKSDQDTIGRFLADECKIGGSTAVQVTCAILRARYERWCHEAGEHPVTAKRLGMDLRDRFNVSLEKAGSVRSYGNLSILQAPNESFAFGDYR